ncbi:MAG: class I SAM-dependent methyltransferase [Pseudomonadota bacterium]
MNCRICGNEKDNKPYTGKDVWAGSDELFDYFQCAQCGCLQIVEYPENIADYYPDNYYSFQVARKQSALYKALINRRNHYAVFRSGFLGRLLFERYPTNLYNSLLSLDLHKDSKILDVGCGDGSFMNSLHDIGFTNLLGVDPFLVKEFSIGDELKIRKQDIYDLDGEFDFIILKGTFEHQPHPQKLLSAINRLLRPGGRSVIRIPVVSSYAWEHYKEDWVQFDAPRHFYLHSEESMRILVEQANMELVRSTYDSDALQFIGSEQLRKNIALNDPRSYLVNPEESIFTDKEISAFRQRVQELDEKRQGDVVIFEVKKAAAA